jgi:hypothetical protein
MRTFRPPQPNDLSNFHQQLCEELNSYQLLTSSGAVRAGVRFLELSNASAVVAATIADASKFVGIFVVKNVSSGGTEAHTVTLTSGTWDGTNDVATLNAPDELLCVYFDSNGDGTVILNQGSVGLS